jgi:hypothetical protein
MNSSFRDEEAFKENYASNGRFGGSKKALPQMGRVVGKVVKKRFAFSTLRKVPNAGGIS